MYVDVMLQARLFDEFNGTDALLVWGEVADMRFLRDALMRLVKGESAVVVGEGANRLTICATVEPGGDSHVRSENGFLRWDCAANTLRHAIELLEPLLLDAGHQYLDVTGEADEVIISAGEYHAQFGS